MKLVRIWFTKTGTAKYISHLDLNRCVSRAFHKAKIPLWYTEGFNPHPFLTFALPLSLGISGEKESMDIKLQEEMPYEEILLRLNNALPPDIRVYSVTEPKMKPGQIAFASFVILLHMEEPDAEQIKDQICSLLRREEIIVPKRSKSGIKEINLKPWLSQIQVKSAGVGLVRLDAVLPAGSTENVNPGLLLDAMEKYLNIRPFTDIFRTSLYNKDMKEFS